MGGCFVFPDKVATKKPPLKGTFVIFISDLRRSLHSLFRRFAPYGFALLTVLSPEAEFFAPPDKVSKQKRPT